MASSMVFLFFILITLDFMPALGRSTAPSAGNEAALEQAVGRRYSHVSSPLSPQHFFYANSQKNFSWDNPGLQRRLWSGQPERAPQGLRPTPTEKRHVQKRAPRVLGTLVNIPSCLGCAPAEYNGKMGTLDHLTVMFLEGVQLTTPAQLLNSCLFYTSILGTKDKDRAPQLEPVLGQTPSSLSKTATAYGCKQNPKLYSIWEIYSAGADKMASSNDPRQWNYWVAYEPGTWLYEGLYIQGKGPELDEQVKIREYFENLSVAFANNCGGTIRVMTLDPTGLAKYGYIWGTKELPALRAKINSPGPNGVTNLIAIDAIDMTLQYMVDWNTLVATRQIAKEDPLYYDPAQLRGRDTCDQSTAYELNGQDWFG
ncbi:hypothetical protein ANO14919_068580 [Xylariales sp. No.14919]|nr:hypothetical protein ANO14919_068580 [Xylariales sp. No.14919]